MQIGERWVSYFVFAQTHQPISQRDILCLRRSGYSMNSFLGLWRDDEAIRITWYMVGVLAIVVSVVVSIFEILR